MESNGESSTASVLPTVRRRTVFATGAERIVPALAPALMEATGISLEWASEPLGHPEGLIYDCYLWHVSTPHERHRESLVQASCRAIQPATLLSFEPRPGMGKLVTQARRLGFKNLTQGLCDRHHLDACLEEIRRLAPQYGHLIPLLQTVLPWESVRTTRALTAVTDHLPELRTVRSWVRVSGFTDRGALGKLLKREAMPPPKTLLSLLRCLAVVDWVNRQARPVSRADIAEEFRYGSAGYLGKHGNRMAGVALGTLIEDDVHVAAHRLADWVESGKV